MKEWLLETHGTRFELVRHFLPGFFDSDLVATRGEWSRVAAGVAGMLASSWMLLFALLFFKYKKLSDLGLGERMATESANDVLSLTAMAMCIAGVMVAVLWQSIYPTLRDCLAMAAWPIGPYDIFLAKFTALTLAFLIFAALLLFPAAVVTAAMTAAPFFATLFTFCSASAVVFFGAIAVQGLLLNFFPARWFERAATWMQAAIAAVSLGGFWMAASKGHIALAGTPFGIREAGIAIGGALFSYSISFHRYRRLLQESPLVKSPGRAEWPTRILDALVPNPREQAIHGFLWKTVQRSRIHRLAVLIYAALALAWMGNNVLGSASASKPQQILFTAYPLSLLILSVAGMRHLFRLPTELRANWIFQITEREGRADWMRAVERFVFAVGIVPLVVIGAALVYIEAGPFTAIAWTVIALFVGAIAFEILFRGWQKLPFTCSYLPGKRPLLITGSLFLALSPALILLALVVYASATNPASFVIVFAIGAGVWHRMRTVRMRTWGTGPLRFEESAEAEVETFDLAGEGTLVAQEQFQREWSRFLRDGNDSPLLRPLDEGETRLSRIGEWLRAVPQDIRHAIRVLRKSPGFVTAVVLTLGLGLGLNGAFFTVFNAFLLRPLAVRDPGSLFSITFESRNKTELTLQLSEFETLAANPQGFTELAANTLEGSGLEGQSARIALVSDNLFSMLGVPAYLGRVLQPGDDSELMVLSHRTWQNRFGGDPTIVGRKLLLNGVRFEVIGIAAPEFAGVAVGTATMGPVKFARFGVGAPDCWLLAKVWNRIPGIRTMGVLGIVGRLRPETNETRAKAMIGAHVRRMTADKPIHERIMWAQLESMDVAVTWTTLSYSFPLLVAFALTMLIPCANAANILLARATIRQRELGTRLSLGASRGRVVRQMLTEGFVLAVFAGGVGLAVAHVALDAFRHWLFSTAPPTMLRRVRIPDFTLDPYVWVYMALLAGATTVLFALAPAAQSTRISVATALRGEFGGWRVSVLRDSLIVIQVALCTMLLAASGLLLTGTRRITNIERGYDTTGVYGVGNESEADARALEPILRGESWTDTVAVLGRPFNEANTMELSIEGAANGMKAYYLNGSGELFRLVRLPLRQGRTFTREEGENQSAVTVVSEATARALWPGQDPIGRTVKLGTSEAGKWRPKFGSAMVVGVCQDIVVKVRDGGPRPTIYFPDRLRPGTVIAARAKGTPEQSRAQMAAAMARAPGAQHGAWLVELHETIDWETYPQQAVAWLATILGAVAILLTISGIYGVMQYLVSQRLKEIGIRMALGATAGHILRFVLSYSGRLAGIGTVFGLFLAVGVLQYLGSKMELLVDLFDAGAYAMSFALAALAGLIAVLKPVRRACKVDPHSVLRAD